METKRFVYFQEDEMFIGWLEEYPDCKSQGETLEELKENLREIYGDLRGGAIPHVLRVGELDVASQEVPSAPSPALARPQVQPGRNAYRSTGPS